jgi:polyhydroxyalkanoate synthesis regulator phasin
MAQTSPSADPTSLVELLTKGIVLTTDRIQATLDDAVRRGRMTRDDAEDLTRALVDSGRKQTEDLLHDLEALIGRSIDAAGDASRRAGDRARRVAGLGGGVPISRYDELTAAQVIDRLNGLDAGDLRRVRDHEARNGNRKTVLRAIDSKLR